MDTHPRYRRDPFSINAKQSAALRAKHRRKRETMNHAAFLLEHLTIAAGSLVTPDIRDDATRTAQELRTLTGIK
jgi:hypothetical protein